MDDRHATLADVAGESLAGRLLVAMPGIGDPRFARSVIYLFVHGGDQGAMGLVVNRPAGDIHFRDLLSQLDLPPGEGGVEQRVRLGGPVEVERGFVLHSPDYHNTEATLKIDDRVSMTATLDILREIAVGRGPEKSLFALGYAGWAPGQLEEEILGNGWLHCEADDHLVFDAADAKKWDEAMAKIGVDPSMLSAEAGRA